MKTRFLTFCDSYHANPELYEVHDEEALKYRYRYLQLRDTSELRLSQLCTSGQDNQVITASQAGDSQ